MDRHDNNAHSGMAQTHRPLKIGFGKPCCHAQTEHFAKIDHQMWLDEPFTPPPEVADNA